MWWLLPIAGGAIGLAVLSRRRGGSVGSFTLTDSGPGGLLKTSTGIRNVPSNSERSQLLWTAAQLDTLFRLADWTIGADATTTSGFRSEAVNTAVGGSKTSDHRKGRAADLMFSHLGAESAATVIYQLHQSGLLPNLDQCIWYGFKLNSRGKRKGGGHMHLGWRQNARGQFKRVDYVLTSAATSARPKWSKVYSAWKP